MQNIEQHIEHTLLKQDATKEELKKLFEEAKKYNFKGVCVNPCNVKFAKEELKNSDVKIVTVVGFPLGANVSDVKAFETKLAIQDGADEIDMVINVSALKDCDYELVKSDIKKVKAACGTHTLKVILETDLLTKEEIKKACEICVEANADFVKTSTGFSTSGAQVADVELMRQTVGDAIKIKAAGGIHSYEEAMAMIDAGADRLGVSASVKILNGAPK